MTSAFFTFPRVSLETVAMITQCPWLKSSKRGPLPSFSAVSSLLAGSPSYMVSFFMTALSSQFFVSHNIPCKQNTPFFWFLWKWFYLDYNVWQCLRHTIYICVSWFPESKRFIWQPTLPTSTFQKY